MNEQEMQDRIEALEATLARLRRSQWIGPVLRGALPRVEPRDRVPTADELQLYRVVVKRGEPDELYVALHDGNGDIEWRDLGAAAIEAGAPSPHQIGGEHHAPDTLANLNTKLSDATLDSAGDPRDANAHASSHESGGADALDGGELGFTAGEASHWAASPPATLQEAVDRLAAAFEGEHGPVP